MGFDFSVPFDVEELATHRRVIRWDAVEGSARVLVGDQPVRAWNDPVHWFQYGKSSSARNWSLIQIPAGSRVRVQFRDRSLSEWPESLFLRGSQGSALFEEIFAGPIQYSTEKGELLTGFEMTPPWLDQDWLLWIGSASENGYPPDFSLYYSRLDPTPELKLRRALPIHGNPVRRHMLMEVSEGRFGIWSELQPGFVYELESPPGARVDLESRLLWTGLDRQRFYTIQADWHENSDPESPLLKHLEKHHETRLATSTVLKKAPFTAPWTGHEGALMTGRKRSIAITSVPDSTNGVWRIKTDQTVLVRALLHDEEPFLFPDRNSPSPALEDFKQWQEGLPFPQRQDVFDLWGVTAESVWSSLNSDPYLPWEAWSRWELVDRLLRDPSRKLGGLIAADITSRWARQEPLIPEWSRRARDVELQGTFFRNLIPMVWDRQESAPSDSLPSILNAGFLKRSFLAEAQALRWQDSEIKNRAMELVDDAYWVRLSPSPVSYQWKGEDIIRKARISLAALREKTDSYQSDTPLTLSWTTFPSGGARELYWFFGLENERGPHLSETGRLVAELSDSQAPNWFEPGIDRPRTPWTLADTIDLMVPAGDHSGKLEIKGSPSLVSVSDWSFGAVQMQDALEPKMGESDILTLSQPPWTEANPSGEQTAPENQVWEKFWLAYKRFKAQPEADIQLHSQLEADWVPTFRRLYSLETRFASGVRPVTAWPELSTMSAEDWLQKSEAALDQEDKEQWVNALEQWLSLRWDSASAHAEKAWDGALRCLESLDEKILRNRLIHGLILYPPPNVSQGWRNSLVSKDMQSAMELGDEAVVTELLTAIWLQNPDVQNTTQWLLWNARIGRTEETLKVAAISPWKWQNPEFLAQAAFEADWGQLFQSLIEELNDETSKKWEGLAAVRKSDFVRGMHQLRQGGEEGKSWADFINESLDLKSRWERITQYSSNLENSAASFEAWNQDWLTWSLSYPGPSRYKEEIENWERYSESGYLYSSSRDLFTPVVLVLPDSPARYRLNHSGMLKVMVRPVAGRDATRTEVMNLELVYANGQSFVSAVADSPISGSLEYIGIQPRKVGAESVFVIETPEDVTPGAEIVVKTNGSAAIVRIMEFTPLYDIAAVPLWSHSLQSEWKNHQLKSPFISAMKPSIRKAGAQSRWRWINSGFTPKSHKANSQSVTVTTNYPLNTDRSASGITLNSDRDSQSEDIELSEWEDRASRALANPDLFELIKEEARLRRFESQAAGSEKLSSLLESIGEKLTWERLLSVEQSAGIHRSERYNQTSIYLGTRVREALFEDETDPDGIWLSDEKTNWVRSGDAGREGLRWRFEFQLCPLVYWENEPALVAILNEKGETLDHVTLSDNQRKATTLIDWSMDRATIGFYLPDKKPQQFVQVTAWLESASKEQSVLDPIRIIETEQESSVFVTTRSTPIRHTFETPAWVRVDKWQSGSWITWQYLAHETGEIELLPAADEDQAFFRLYHRVPRDVRLTAETPATAAQEEVTNELESKKPVNRTWGSWLGYQNPSADDVWGEGENYQPGSQEDGTSELATRGAQRRNIDEETPATAAQEEATNELESKAPVIRTWGPLPGRQNPIADDVWREGEDYQLGRQEDGTWELETRGVQRRNIDEETAKRFAELYLQMSVTGRWRMEKWRSYLQAGALQRFREEGGTTLGLNGEWTWNPVWWGGSIRLSSDWYEQKPEGSRWNPLSGADSEWAGWTRLALIRRYEMGEQWQWTPNLTGWVRGLSLHDTGAYSANSLDRDIFTSYKQSHQHGLTLGSTLKYAPKLDQQGWLRLNAGSNEDWNIFKPDYIGSQVGWRSMFGSLESEFSYRGAYYLKDADRSRNVWRHFLESQLQWTRWPGSSNRWKLSARIAYDLVELEWTGWLGFSWLWSEGRRLNDFRASESWFPAIWDARLRE